MLKSIWRKLKINVVDSFQTNNLNEDLTGF
jgi:hypothetical protein